MGKILTQKGRRVGIPRRSWECRSPLCRSGVAPPTGTIHPRRGRGTESRKQKSRNLFSDIPFQIPEPVGECRSSLSRSKPIGGFLPTLSRSGVEPPTGTIHPRKGRGTESRKQKSRNLFSDMPFQIPEPVGECRSSLSRSKPIGGFPPTLSRSGVAPPTGTIHPRQIPPPTPNPENHPPKQTFQLFPAFCPLSSAHAWMDHSGRGFNPRPAKGPTGSRTNADFPSGVTVRQDAPE